MEPLAPNDLVFTVWSEPDPLPDFAAWCFGKVGTVAAKIANACPDCGDQIWDVQLQCASFPMPFHRKHLRKIAGPKARHTDRKREVTS